MKQVDTGWGGQKRETGALGICSTTTRKLDLEEKDKK